MKELSSRVIFIPRYDLELPKKIKFICKDNTIHIRLKNYNKPQTIIGFSNKLAFLLTFLFSRLNEKDDFITESRNFKDDKVYIELMSAIYPKYPEITDISILKAYFKNKKSLQDDFGYVSISDLSLYADTKYGTFEDNLTTFLAFFNFDSLEAYFDDRIYIELTPKKVDLIKSFKKYINKANRSKKQKLYDEENLWF